MIGNTLNPCVSAPQGKMTPDTFGTLTPVQLKTRAEVLLQREAYAAGLRTAGYLPSVGAKFAAEKYPLPKKIVPRESHVVGYNGIYRIMDGKVQYRTTGSATWQQTSFTAEDFKAFGELAANPTCEVDE